MGFQAPSSPGKDVAMANRQSWRGSYSPAFFLWTWGLLLAGWNPGLHFCKEKPADSHILHWPRPMALHLFGLFWTPRGFFWGGGGWGAAQGRWVPGFLVWPRGELPGLVWGEGSGCCSLCNNKSASAHRLWWGCSVCLWAQDEGLAEGG